MTEAPPDRQPVDSSGRPPAGRHPSARHAAEQHAVRPSTDDPVVAGLSEVLGGPVGHHAAASRPTGSSSRWAQLVHSPAAVVVLVGTGVMALAAAMRSHCRATGWASPDQFTHACYSDIPTTVNAAGLATGTVPYLDPVAGQYLTQPVGTGFTLWGLASLAPGGDEQLRWVFDLAVLLLVAALAVVVVCVALLSRHRPWDAALVAASPVLLTSALVSLDLLAVALALAGVVAFSRRHPVAAGVLVGLAVTVRPIAVVVLVALALLAARTGHRGPVVATCVAAAITWVGLNLPVVVLSPDGWAAYWSSLWNTPVGYGSLWLVPQLLAAELGGQATVSRAPGWAALTGLALVAGAALVYAAVPRASRRDWLPRSWWTTGALAGAVVLLPAMLVRFGPEALQWLATHQVGASAARWITGTGLVAVGIAVAIFALGTERRPRLPALVLVLTVGVLVALPAIPVQAAVWVLPFAALAVPRWRDLLVWGSVEAVYATCTWLYLYGLSVPERGLPPWLYVVVTLARLAALGWLVHRAVSLARNPQADPVRAHDLETDDPAAGELEDAPDALVVTFS